MPMAMVSEAGPEVLDGLSSRELVCIDDIDCVAGHTDWEIALFDMCNQIFDAGSQLLVSAISTPRECPVEMADLASRLARLPVFQVHALDDDESVSALQLRSRHRGLELPEDTARYLLKRSRRDMASLYELLDTLDKEALRAKRRLTIPFVRDVLAATSG